MMQNRPNINGGLSLTLSFPSLPRVPLSFYKRVKASMQCRQAHVQCTQTSSWEEVCSNITGSTGLHATNYSFKTTLLKHLK